MTAVNEFINTLLSTDFFKDVFPSMMQVLLLTIFFYILFRFIRVNVLNFGYSVFYAICLVLYGLCKYFQLGFLIEMMYVVVAFAMPLLGIFLFQNDLRHLMIRLARGYVAYSRNEHAKERNEKRQELVDELVKTVCALTTHDNWRSYLFTKYGLPYRDLPDRNTGALIALQMTTEIQRELDASAVGVAGIGEELSCKSNWMLLRTIFYTGTPLHDGGVIINRNGMIIRAGCRFPAFEADDAKIAHTRHNAGLGLSAQVPDAWVLVVSEESGRVSICESGEIKRQSSPRELYQNLCKFYGLPSEDASSEGKRSVLQRSMAFVGPESQKDSEE